MTIVLAYFKEVFKMSILKRAIPLLLCVVLLVFVLVACDTDSSEETPSGTTSHTHTPAAAVQENYVDSTCTQTGSYDEVVYCSVCHEEISRTQKTVDKNIHLIFQRLCGCVGIFFAERVKIKPAKHRTVGDWR